MSHYLILLSGRCILVIAHTIFFFNCYLAVPWPTLDHSQGDSLTNPMLITAFVHIRPEGHREPITCKIYIHLQGQPDLMVKYDLVTKTLLVDQLHVLYESLPLLFVFQQQLLIV